MSLIAKINRPLLLCALVLGLGAGVASAANSCSPCSAPPKPVKVSVSPCRTGCPDVSYQSTTYVSPSAYVAPTAYNSADAYVTDSAPVSYYTTSSVPNDNMPYLIPSQAGTIEAASVPMEDNEVTRYYNAHEVDGITLGDWR